MASVRPIKNDGKTVGWTVDFTNPATLKRATKNFEMQTDARLFRSAMETELGRVLEGRSDMPIEAACEAFMADLDTKNAARLELSANYRVATDRHIKKFFTGRKLKTITLHDLHVFDAYLISPVGADLALTTAKQVMSVLRQVLAKFKITVMDGFRRFESKSFRKFHQAEPAVALTLNEVRRLLDHSEGLERVSLHVLILAGLRSSELTALRWRHIKPKGIEVLTSTPRKRFVKEAGKDRLVGKPSAGKTDNSSRVVTGTPELMTALTERFATTEFKGENDFVICHDDGTPFSYEELSYMLRAVQNVINGDLPSARNRELTASNHVFRHTCVSLMIDAGMSIDDIAARLGHANPVITVDCYWHFLGENFE